MTEVRNKDFFSVIEERQSVRSFDTDYKIPRHELKEMIKAASSAPSSWNLQHWKFLVLDEQEAQGKLLPIAFNQQQVKDASAVIAVLGDLEANKNAESVFGNQVKNGLMSEEAKETVVGNINNAYQSIPDFGKSEALKNTSLAAMQLMLAAKAFGYDSGPMGGFDPQGLMKEFNISSRYLPVMLIAIGKKEKDAHPTTRFSADDITFWNNFNN
jgi:nitroreductase